MATPPHRRRRPGTAVSDPGVITGAEWDTAMGYAAADAAVFDADWAALSDRERALAAAVEDVLRPGRSLPGPGLHPGPPRDQRQ